MWAVTTAAFSAERLIRDSWMIFCINIYCAIIQVYVLLNATTIRSMIYACYTRQAAGLRRFAVVCLFACCRSQINAHNSPWLPRMTNKITVAAIEAITSRNHCTSRRPRGIGIHDEASCFLCFKTWLSLKSVSSHVCELRSARVMLSQVTVFPVFATSNGVVKSRTLQLSFFALMATP